jgi:phasin family protein
MAKASDRGEGTGEQPVADSAVTPAAEIAPAQTVIAVPAAKPMGDAPARKAKSLKTGAVAKSGGVRSPGSAMAGNSSTGTRKASKSSTAIKAAPLKKAAAGPAKRSLAAPRTGPGGTYTDTRMHQSKETKMSSNPENTNFTAPMNDAVSEMQTRSQAAYEKSSEMMGEMSDTAKGNVEAMVESGKIFQTGMQDLARAYVEDAKSVYEQMTADLKEMAAVKSPTELLQLQGKILRRNFDTMVAASSKNTEKMMKLSNDAFAPISARLSVAAEKMTKVG